MITGEPLRIKVAAAGYYRPFVALHKLNRQRHGRARDWAGRRRLFRNSDRFRPTVKYDPSDVLCTCNVAVPQRGNRTLQGKTVVSHH